MIEQKNWTWVPEIDLKHCKGCGECIAACPKGVLELSPIEPSDYKRYGWITRMQIRHHGMMAIYAVRPEECLSCARCLKVCQKHAIHKKQIDKRNNGITSK